jgi:hypothetical protein
MATSYSSSPSEKISLDSTGHRRPALSTSGRKLVKLLAGRASRSDNARAAAAVDSVLTPAGALIIVVD